MTIETLIAALTPPGFCSGCGRKLTCRWRHQGPSRSQLKGVCPRCERADSCVHHWMLESPKGKTVAGTCAHCGRTRSFPSEHNWREPTPEERAQRRAIRLQSEQELTDATTE